MKYSVNDVMYGSECWWESPKQTWNNYQVNATPWDKYAKYFGQIPYHTFTYFACIINRIRQNRPWYVNTSWKWIVKQNQYFFKLDATTQKTNDSRKKPGARPLKMNVWVKHRENRRQKLRTDLSGDVLCWPLIRLKQRD